MQRKNNTNLILLNFFPLRIYILNDIFKKKISQKNRKCQRYIIIYRKNQVNSIFWVLEIAIIFQEFFFKVFPQFKKKSMCIYLLLFQKWFSGQNALFYLKNKLKDRPQMELNRHKVHTRNNVIIVTRSLLYQTTMLKDPIHKTSE